MLGFDSLTCYYILLQVVQWAAFYCWRNKMEDITFAENIKQFRKAKSMSMEELGKRLGKAKSTISAWENGKRTPKINELKSISEALGVTISQLLGIG
ncbi:XRE family transcriptional regulator [Lactococcus lactis]|nr:helix-turn-helix domain-containing protein [Lactococcus lactis]MCT3120374.1 XRE family transcriptional regulator [Lactococcus lactis]QPT51642.1 helix-turn-helix transcriptional regulator [Lactococcus lactis]